VTMDHPPEPLLPSPPPNHSGADEARLETLLRQTIAEQTADVAPSPDALPRLNARLDAAHAPKRWFGPFRLAGAVAVALILLALVTPVGRLAAANVTHGVQNATETVITTVKQIVSGGSGSGSGSGSDSSTPPPHGTLPATNATSAPASRTAPTNGAGSPASGTAANPSSVTRTGTPADAGSAVAPVSPTPLIGTRAANTPASAAATASATATVATPGTSPTATIAATTPTTAIKGTPPVETVSPAPIARPTGTVSPP